MSLVTRQYGPDAKGLKLTNLDMDNNLYYLQSIGVSGLTFSSSTLSLINPTGGTISSVEINVDNRWYIPSGTTVEIESYSQSFIYGDLYVLGELILNQNSQLIILNGNLILSGGTLSGSGQTVLVDLPTFNDLITSGTYSGGTLTLSTSNGSDVTVNGFFTPTNGFTTGVTYNSSTNTITLTDNTNNSLNAYIDGFSGLTVNGILSATTYDNLPQDVFVTGGTYTNGEILFKNNSGGAFTVTGLPIGGAGGEVYYLNLSQSQPPYQEFSPIGSNLTEQTTGVTINSGVTSTIASFLTPTGYPNATKIPAGVWSFYLHSYKDVVNASFDVFCEVYVYTTGGTETLLLTTAPAEVLTDSPTTSMELTDGYYSGSTIDITDRILVKVRTKNTGSQTNTITFFTEGQQNYSYGITPFSNFNALTCETLSGCTTIFNLENNKVNKGGDTMTGTLNVPTISATTYQNLPDNVTGNYLPLSGGTVTGSTSFTNGLTANTISATTYDNLPIDPDTFVTGFTYGNNVFTIKQNNGQSDLTSTINSVTGWTVNGVLTVTGDTSVEKLTANTVKVNDTSGTPDQAASFNVNGRLVAGLGQTTFATFGDSSLTAPTLNIYTLIPNLTQTISVPSNCSVFITTTGGVGTSNNNSNTATVDIAIFIDGALLPSGGFSRINSVNPNAINNGFTNETWAVSTIQTLSAGNHTIDVRVNPRSITGGNIVVSGPINNVRQGELYITIIKN